MTPNSVDSKNSSGYRPARSYDFEHHFMTPEYFECLKNRKDYPRMNKDGIIEYLENATTPVFVPSYFIDKKYKLSDHLTNIDDLRIKYLDEAGVTFGVISAEECPELLPKEDAVRLTRLANDKIAEAVKKHPDRFVGSFVLPMPYVEEALKELDRAVNVLGLKYWHTHSNYGKEALYMEKFEPVLAKCAELGAAFYIHPQFSSSEYLRETGIAMASASFGFGVDTMRTSLRLILNGIFDKYPNLKMIIGHMGEYYPFTLARIDSRLSTLKDFDPTFKAQHPVSYYFKNKNIFISTSGIYDPNVVICTINVIGIDNILFATDFPFEPFAGEFEFIRNLPISDEDKDKIFYKNAEKYIFNNGK